MPGMDLGLAIRKQLRRVDQQSVFDIRAFSDSLYDELSEEQRQQVDAERLRDIVLRMASRRFPALRW